ncbi:hypothetical protein [Variovorax paradoxus]|uniref:hypothetical protein n=1 Tax=Variovorax TaxID=34072 RepID=UPI001ABBF763
MPKPLPALSTLPPVADPPAIAPATAEMGSLRAALILGGALYAAVLLALWAIDAYFHASPL